MSLRLVRLYAYGKGTPLLSTFRLHHPKLCTRDAVVATLGLPITTALGAVATPTSQKMKAGG